MREHGTPHLRMQDLILLGEWADRGACRGEPTDAFFPVAHNTGRRGGTNSIYRRARTVCAGCPVRTECLTHAIRAGEIHGMWGGLTPKERFALRHTVPGAVPIPACPHCGEATYVHAGKGVQCPDCSGTAARRARRNQEKP